MSLHAYDSELAIAVLACARIGAVHSVVFAGFSAKSLADRINDAACKVLVTADGGFRGNKIIPLKKSLMKLWKILHLLNSVLLLKEQKQCANAK